MEQGVGMAALKSQTQTLERVGTPPMAAEVPVKHWQESGSPGPTEEGPLAHRLTRGPPPSSPWERTRALTVRRETGCWESLIPAGGGPGARRASRGSPAPPSPGGQRGLREPSGLPHPWDIPSEGQLGPWTEQALKRHVHTHTGLPGSMVTSTSSPRSTPVLSIPHQ